MNTNNGNIESIKDLLVDLKIENKSEKEQIEQLEAMDYVPINEIHMTKKQRRERKVSLNDHRSILGKQLTAIQQRKKVFGK